MSRIPATAPTSNFVVPGDSSYDLPSARVAKSGDLYSWAWQRNLNLIGKDDLSIRHFYSVPRRPEAWKIPPSWTNTHRALYIGKDTMTAGFRKGSYELPPAHYIPKPITQQNTWTWDSRRLLLVGKDRLVTGKQVYDLAPPVNHPSAVKAFPNFLRQWEWKYNQNLIGKDKLPTGKQVSDASRLRPDPVVWYRTWELNLSTTTLAAQFPPGESIYDLVPRGYPRVEQSWYWSYNLNLIGQDKFPTGEIIYDLAPKGYQPLLQTWYWNYNLNLIGQDQLPTGEQTTERSPRGYPPLVPSWTWQYNLNLIGQDKLPTGESYTERPPPLNFYRSWELNLQLSTLNVIIPFAQFDWPTPKGYPRAEQSWYWAYNVNLIGQDQLPTGENFTERPPPVYWYREWLQNPLSLRVTINPFNQFDWPFPRAYPRAEQSWYWSYNQNLIGKDQLPTGKDIYDLPQIPPYPFPPQLRIWTWWYNLNLIGQDKLPTGKQTTERTPRPYEYHAQLRAWYWSYNLNLIGQDKLPTGKSIYDLTLDQRPPVKINQRSWTWQYNLNLIGQDVIYDGPGKVPTYDWQLARGYTPLFQTWMFPTAAALLVVPLPFQQYDWPVPRDYQRGIQLRSWTWEYNRNLIGKDKLPTGKNIYELTPGQIPPLMLNQRSWYWRYNLNLIGKDRLPTGKDIYDLSPRQVPPRMLQQRSWEWSYNLNLIAKDRLPVGKDIRDLPPPWGERVRRPIQIFYDSAFIPFMPTTVPTVTMAVNDLALIHNQQFVFYTPDDIMTYRTRHVYLNMRQAISPFAPRLLVFHRPNDSTFSVTVPEVSIGVVNLLTPKGLFIAGQYYVYTVAIDKFVYPGVWSLFHVSDGNGAMFYVEQRRLH